MTSFLGKLRQRAISQSTVGSRKSHHSAEPLSHSNTPPVVSEAIGPIPTASITPAPQAEFSPPRQIYPDINALFDTSYSSEPESSSRRGGLGLGLRPPRPRKRSQVAVSLSKTPERRVSPEHSRDVTREDEVQELPSRQSFTSSPGQAASEASQLTQALEDTPRASGSSHRLSLSRLPPTKWSTFGRPKGKGARVARFTPPASARHSQVGSVDSIPPRSASRRTQGSTKSNLADSSTSVYHGNTSRVSFVIYPSHSPSSTVSKSSSARYTQDYVPQSPSPPLTNSSRQNSTINTGSATHSTPSRSGGQTNTNTNTTSSNDEFHSFTMETPGTFGDSTPPRAEHALPIGSIHPELIRAVSTHQASSTQATTSVHAFPTSSSSSPRPPAFRGRTYPLTGTRQSEQAIDNDENTPVATHVQGRPLRGSSSLPRFQDVFPSQTRSAKAKRRSASTARERERSSSRRRRSAEWVARQASSGVNAENVHEYGWPAEVSREMVRLSLGKGTGGISPSGTERGRPPREGHTAASNSLPCSSPCVSGGASASVRVFTSLPSPPPLPNPPLTSLASPAGTYIPRDDSPLPTQSLPSPIDTDPGAIESDSTPRGESSTLIRPGSEVEGDGDAPAGTFSNLDSMPAQPHERARRHRSSLTTTSGASASGSSSTVRGEAATIPRSASSRTPRKSILNSLSQKFNTQSSQPEAGPSTPEKQLGLPSSSTSTPRTPANRPKRSSSEPGLTSVLETPTNSKGKRKADDIEITPPDQKNGQRTTFALPENTRRTHAQSDPSGAPSAYQRKRVRLSTTPSPAPSPGHSRPPTSQAQNANAENTGSWSSRTSGPSPALTRAVSARAASTRSGSVQPQPSTPTTPSRPLHPLHRSHSLAHSRNSPAPSQIQQLGTNDYQYQRRADRRTTGSISEMSIPISALIAPHAPSVSRSSTYHMRDPHRPAPVRPTSWALHLRNEDEDASPFHAWCFFIGFVIFPLWWFASFAPIPRTRRVGGTDVEKAVTLDDPQVEHDARSWRFRCRIMSGISFLTYIPFIVLVAIFVPK